MLKIKSLLIASLLFSQACSKKNLVQQSGYLASILLNDTTPCSNRQIFLPGEVNTFSSVVDAPFLAKYPCFNPKNPFQIVYVKVLPDFSDRNASIVKMDLSTGKQQTVYSQPLTITELNWNSKGEILFVDTRNQQVYSIRDDGSSLKQITNNGLYNGLPIWYHEDSLILIKEEAYRLCNYNSTGNYLDTLPGRWYPYSVDKNKVDDILVPSTSFDTNQLAVIHSNKTISYYSYTLPSRPFLYTDCAKFNPNNNEEVFFYRLAPNNGLFKYNLSTGNLISILPFCPSETLSRFSVSPDGKKIVAEAAINLKLPNGKEGSHSVLLLMNIDGSDKRIINLE